jgi:CubicO group peptidase (beta-lactamase class C family)
MRNENFKLAYEGYTPQDIPGSLAVSTPGAQNMDSSLLDAAFRLIFDENRYIMARSLLVMRNGFLVAEAYPNDPADIDRINNIQSCTKSFTSILAGIALKRGDIDSVNQKLSDIYPEHFTGCPEKSAITLRHALSMKVGLEFENESHTLELYREKKSTVDFVLSQYKLYEPGQVFHYNDGAPQLVSAAIQKRSGFSLGDYAEKYLFDPLGITDWTWEAAADGVTFGAFSLFLKPRDMIKVGLLLLQNGRWNGERILDSTWIQQITTVQGTGNFNGASYGLYFWIFPAYKGFAAEGHGGQVLFVIPDKNLVVVYTAFPYTSSLLWDHYTEFIDLILASCKG